MTQYICFDAASERYLGCLKNIVIVAKARDILSSYWAQARRQMKPWPMVDSNNSSGEIKLRSWLQKVRHQYLVVYIIS
jgi:hypothetical protein